MHDKKEFSATIRTAMQRKKLNEIGLAQALGINPVMVDKILCGEVVPSTHLEKQMVQVLEIPHTRASKVATRRRQNSRNKTAQEAPKNTREKMVRQEKTKKAA